VRWAAVLQKELLGVAWPEVVLEWPECAETYFRHISGEETLIWKGLRVRIGMACGKPQYRKPLNTGCFQTCQPPAPACPAWSTCQGLTTHDLHFSGGAVLPQRRNCTGLLTTRKVTSRGLAHT
jgi:hypothetical protein